MHDNKIKRLLNVYWSLKNVKTIQDNMKFQSLVVCKNDLSTATYGRKRVRRSNGKMQDPFTGA